MGERSELPPRFFENQANSFHRASHSRLALFLMKLVVGVIIAPGYITVDSVDYFFGHSGLENSAESEAFQG